MLNRRHFLKSVGLYSSALLACGCNNSVLNTPAKKSRPNILWITCEDISTWLGCYGDDYADSPNIDAFAGKGLRYNNAFATAPVCSPSRSCLITGVYATSLGTQHLRSDITLPQNIRCFTEYLRNAGYYCSNNDKKDYNFTDQNAWDDSSPTAHWRNKKSSQPFFSVFNFKTTHQSQINGTDEEFHKIYGHKLDQRHDPAKVKLPPYYPDSPMIRKIFARYFDLIQIMDRQVADILTQLESDNLAQDTIVFFYSDHGSGIPRHKRVLYDTGLKVPLIAYFPEKYKHLNPKKPGQTTDRLVSFVDFAPTVLSLLDLPIPDYMQGDAFLGPQTGKPRDYIYGASSRVDEAYEISRCIRDKRYKYIRNYLPHLPLIQKSAYPDKAEIMKELHSLVAQGNLTKSQQALWSKRPAAELYDTQTDPLEQNNLIDSPKHKKIQTRLKAKLKQWMLDTKDLGLLIEPQMLQRSKDSTPYQFARSADKYPIMKILETAELVDPENIDADKLQILLADSDSAVRFWSLIALSQDPAQSRPFQPLLKDPDPAVRFAAAGLLAARTDSKEALDVLIEGLDIPHGPTALYAAREIELLKDKAKPAVQKIDAARTANAASTRHKDYIMFTDWALTESLRSCGVQTDYIIKF